MDNSSFDDCAADSYTGIGLGDGISAGVSRGCLLTGSGAAGCGISTRTGCGTASACTGGNWGGGCDGGAVGNFCLGLVADLDGGACGCCGVMVRRCVILGAGGGDGGTEAGGEGAFVFVTRAEDST